MFSKPGSQPAPLPNAGSAHELLVQPSPRLYFPGEILTGQVYKLDGMLCGEIQFLIQQYAGSGFAGQVYQARLAGNPLPGCPTDLQVALKILRPASRWKEFFRDSLFFLTCQVAFAPRLRAPAVRAGLLTAELISRAAESGGASRSCFAHPLGYFWDSRLLSFIEIYTWEEGRPQRYAPDEGMVLRWLGWEPASPDTEMIRKRDFMAWLVTFCRSLGAAGVARQYEWDTWISQANVLTRLDPEGNAEFVAVDWRVGLAVPFFLPLSPAHARLIWRGLWIGRWTLSDWLDASQLRAAWQAAPKLEAASPGLAKMLLAVDEEYREALPDLWQNGSRIFTERGYRRRVKAALIADWEYLGRVNDDGRSDLQASSLAFWLYYGVGLIPFCGSLFQHLAGNSVYRAHFRLWLRHSAYRWAVSSAQRSCDLREWVQQRRISPANEARLACSLPRYLSQKIFFAWLPSGLHRLVVDSQARRDLFERWFIQPFRLLLSPTSRLEWLEKLLQSQLQRGVITPHEMDDLRVRLQKKRLQALMNDMGYFAGLEIFSRLLYLALGLYGLRGGEFWPLFLAVLGPVSPSGVLRFFYIGGQLIQDLPEIIRQRSRRLFLSRLLGLSLAPWRIIGNFCVPLEMFTFEPRASLVLAEYLTAGLVRRIPIFGGRGKLLEYAAFQFSFCLPLSFVRAAGFWLHRNNKTGQG